MLQVPHWLVHSLSRHGGGKMEDRLILAAAFPQSLSQGDPAVLEVTEDSAGLVTRHTSPTARVTTSLLTWTRQCNSRYTAQLHTTNQNVR